MDTWCDGIYDNDSNKCIRFIEFSQYQEEKSQETYASPLKLIKENILVENKDSAKVN